MLTGWPVSATQPAMLRSLIGMRKVCIGGVSPVRVRRASVSFWKKAKRSRSPSRTKMVPASAFRRWRLSSRILSISVWKSWT